MDDTHTFFWLVGVLEGEGTFLWYPNKGKAIIEMEMKDEHVVARVAALWGVSYYRRDRRERNPNSAVTYQVRLTGVRAIQLMERLAPYMSPRRQRTITRVTMGYRASHPNMPEAGRVPLLTLTHVPYTLLAGEPNG